MDLSEDWGDVVDELLFTTLEQRGIGFDPQANPSGIRRLRTQLLAMLHSDVEAATARCIEQLVVRSVDSLNDVQLWMGLHDTDLDHVDLHRLIQAIDPTAPPPPALG